MSQPPDQSPAQDIVDAIIEGAALAEVGRIAQLARQGLQDPLSLTQEQARHVFAAYVLLFDPQVTLRGEVAPPPLLPAAWLAAARRPRSVDREPAVVHLVAASS